jgi:D-aminoacyl-tRNA deacylase
MEYDPVFIATKSDEASLSIYNYFISNGPDLGKYILTEGRLPMLEFPEKLINNEDKVIIFLSRHSSKAKVNSITVHPVGNFSTNDIGGRERNIARSAPEIQTAILRKMSEVYSGEKYQVTFEATHHGPESGNRLIFAEIGTEPENWKDSEALRTLFLGVRDASPKNYPNYVGAGGGHYAPKFSSYVLKENVNVGHIISKFRMDEIGKDEVLMAVEKTEKCKGFLVDKKGIKSAGMGMIREVADQLGLEIITI